GFTTSEPSRAIQRAVFAYEPPSRFTSTCCDACAAFQAVIARIAATPTAAYTWAARVARVFDRSAGRARTSTTTQPTAPRGKARVGRYQPFTARNNPTEPNVRTPAAAASARNRNQPGGPISDAMTPSST